MLTLPQTIEQDGTEDRRELDRLLAGVAAGDRDALARLYRLTRTPSSGSGTARPSISPRAPPWAGS